MYQKQFNPAVPLTTINPGIGTGTNNSVSCTNAVVYNSPNTSSIPVYTPGSFELNYSLSHLEDECPTVGGSCGLGCEDVFYSMSNELPLGIKKRAPKEQERLILSNLGYHVTNTFGTTLGLNLTTSSTYTTTTTTSPALGLGTQVVGYCDGFISGAYSNSVAPGATISIPVSTILANDYNATGVVCPEIINQTGSTIAIVGNNLVLNASPTAIPNSIILVRYIPTRTVGSSTFYGNITYIYVNVEGNCQPSACNMISDPGFENIFPGIPCTITAGGNGAYYLPCWRTVMITNSSSFNITLLSTNSACNLAPAILPQSLGLTNIMPPVPSIINPNQNILKFNILNPNNIYNCAISTKLATPLVNGSYYTFKIKMLNATNFTYTTPPTTFFNVGGSNGQLIQSYPTSFFSNANVLHIDNSLENIIVTPTSISASWQSTTINFQYLGTASIDHLILGFTSLGLANLISTIFIDDVELTLNPNFTFTPPAIPSNSCNAIITNLSQYLNIVPTSGLTFAGPNNSVYLNGTQWEFNSALAGNGNAIVTASYVQPNGCVVTASANIMVSNLTVITPSATSTAICVGSSTTLSASGASTYTWQPTVPTSGVVSPTTTTTYTVTGTSATGCTATATITINVLTTSPTLTIASLPLTSIICLGQTATLTASGAGTGGAYVWSGGIANAVAFSPTVTTTYTVTGTNAAGCTATATKTITVLSSTNYGACASASTTVLPTILTGTNLPSGNKFKITANTFITGNVSITAKDIAILGNYSITVNAGAQLLLSGSHLHGCTAMWKGIVVLPGGKLYVQNNSLIEDALLAIDVTHANTNSQLVLSQAIFNKNLTSVSFNNYKTTQANYPFSITNCVFTSRDRRSPSQHPHEPLHHAQPASCTFAGATNRALCHHSHQACASRQCERVAC
jgi:hypothetical protein